MAATAQPAARPCPACGAEARRLAFVRDGYDHMRCRGCGTLYVSPLPDEETIRATYEDIAYHEAKALESQRIRDEMRARARILQGLGVASVLEIGCGVGHFLQAAGELGIDAVGLDPGADEALMVAEGLTFHDVWLGDFVSDRRFDAIAMWEVIEHLTDPLDALVALKKWLKPRGLLALSTPSCSGVSARVLGSRFPMICPPEHLELFSRTGLRSTLSRAGFEPVRWTSFSNLDGDAIARNLQRYFLGDSAIGERVAGLLGRAAVVPVRMLDRAGLGISFEVYATSVD